jgi:hypothetical protein
MKRHHAVSCVPNARKAGVLVVPVAHAKHASLLATKCTSHTPNLVVGHKVHVAHAKHGLVHGPAMHVTHVNMDSLVAQKGTSHASTSSLDENNIFASTS